MRIDILKRTIRIIIFFVIAQHISGQELFWVGNNGNWNNANNWATTSGGAGGAGIPGIADDVIFDNNSGNCNILGGAAANSVLIDMSATIEINSDLTVNDNINFRSGIINNSATIIAAGIISTGSADRTFDSSTGTIKMTAISPQLATLSLNSDNLNFGGVDSLIFSGAELSRLETSGTLGIFNYVEFTIDGEIYGDNEINTLRITNGKSLYLQNGSKQIINIDLVTNDPCNGYATISGFLESDDQASLDIRIQGNYRPSGFFFRKIDFIVIVQGVRFPIDLRFSIDGGENEPWAESSNPAPRVLYWVGGQGEWFDSRNWSLLSGGPGGECVPTSIDDVVFDNNSFDTNSDLVSSESAAYCNNFIYTAPEAGTNMDLPQLYISNDLLLDRAFNWFIGSVILSGNREGGASRMQIVRTGGTELQNLRVFSERSIELEDNLNVRDDITIGGFDSSVRFISNGYDINTGRFFAISNDMGLDLTDSYITVSGRTGIEQPLTIRNSAISSMENTRWEFTNEQTGFETNESIIGSVWFNNPGGLAQAFSSAELMSPIIWFEGNGQLFGNDFILDSLIFSAGSLYEINHSNNLSVNSYFESLGDICQPITFRSSIGNIAQELSMPISASLAMSYTQISDIRATGGNAFDAGLGSVDVQGNSGWSFRDPDATEADRFLGPDQVVCNDTEQVTFELNFPPGEVDSVIWNNDAFQSTDPYRFDLTTLNVRPSIVRIVTAEVFFSNGCSQSDTVQVSVNQAFSFDLGADTTLCDGAPLQLITPIDNATYNWSNAAVNQSILVFEQGRYAVTVDSGACSFTDEIIVNTLDLSSLSIGNDTTICDDGIITLENPANFDGSVLWSDNSAETAISVTETGTYWAEFSEDICIYRDSIEIIFDNAFDVNLGNDTTLCNGAELTLSTGRDAGTFAWSTGDTKPLITVSDAGTYIVTVQIGTCIDEDSIVIDRIDIKDFELGDDTKLCEGEETELSVPEDFNGEFQWSTGSSNRTITVTESNEYSLTISEDICNQSDTVVITFDSPQQFSLGQDTSLCSGETLDLTLKDLPMDIAIGINWSTGESSSPMITVSESDTYSVEVSIGACITSDTIAVDIIELASFSLGQDTAICSDQTLLLSAPAEVNDLLWSTASTESSISITESDAYWLEVREGRCSVSDSINVTVDEAFMVDLGADTTLCSGESIELSAADIIGDSYLWNTGSMEESITVNTNEEFSVEIDRGVCSASGSINVSVIDVDNFTFGSDTTLCVGESITLNADLSNQASYVWQDGSNDPTFIVDSDGTYTVTASIERCDATASIEVGFQNPPAVDIGENMTLCAPEFVILDAGITSASYTWQDGSINQTITADISDVYIVNVDDGICTVSDTAVITIQDRPNLSIAADGTGSICQGDSVVLSAMTNGVSYTWQDNSTDDLFIARESGLYYAQMRFGVCEIRDSFNLTVNDNPDISLPSDTTICDGTALFIMLPDNGDSYSWSGINSSSNEVSLSSAGNYSVLVTDGNGCTDTESISIATKETPNFSLGDNQVICEGQSTLLNLQPNYDNVTWNVPNSGSGLSVDSGGTYWAEADLDGCTFRDSVNIEIQSLPIVELGNDTMICEGSTITLDATNEGATYDWSTGETEPMITPPLTGSGSNIGVNVAIRGCEVSDDITISVTATPTFDLGDDQIICEGESVDLLVEPSYENLTWSVPNTGTVLSVNQTDIYWAEADVNGCTYRDSVIIDVQAFPIVDLGSDTILCEGTDITLDATNEGATYEWNTGESTPTIIPDLTQNTTNLQVTVDIRGCVTTDEITINTKETPAFTLEDDVTICEGESFTVSLNNPDNRWTIDWSNGATENEITIDQSGTYTATATIDGCDSSDDFILSVQPLPEFDLGDDISKCEDLTALLSIDRTDVDIVWQDGSTQNQLIVSNPGIYSATATTGLGCSFSDDIEVTNRECVEFTIYIPNAFSPNQDGRNDRFIASVPDGIFVSEFELQIFDRWGNKVFESSDVNIGWDGGGLGYQSMQPGVYVYQVSVRYSDDYQSDVRETFSGNITLFE